MLVIHKNGEQRIFRTPGDDAVGFRDEFIMPDPSEIQVFENPITNKEPVDLPMVTITLGEPVICPKKGESIETTTAIFFRDMDGSIRKEDKNG